MENRNVMMYGCSVPDDGDKSEFEPIQYPSSSEVSGVPVLISQSPVLEKAIETVLEFLNKKTMVRDWIKNTITLSLFNDLSEDKDIEWCKSKAEEILQIILGGEK